MRRLPDIAFFDMALTIMMALMSGAAVADEVLPMVPDESMAAYKNAFGKAISESRAAEKNENDAVNGGNASADKETRLRTLTKKLRDSVQQSTTSAGSNASPDHGGPPPPGGSGGSPGGMMPGSPNGGGFPPPGIGGPGQPGGRPPGGGPAAGGGGPPPPGH
jgi:hypothetical protein